MAAGLACAASVALADTQQITFQNAASGSATLSDDVFVTTGDLSLSNASLTVNPTEWSEPTDGVNAGILRPVAGSNVFLPNVRIDKGTDNNWALTFTLTNDSAVDMTVDSLTLDGLAAYALDGTLQGSGRNVTFTLASTEATLATNTGVKLQDTSANTEAQSTTLTFDSPVMLGSGESLTLTLTASTSNANTLVGLTGMTVGYTPVASPVVPEPATATLSLLALAGLCARRRRK